MKRADKKTAPYLAMLHNPGDHWPFLGLRQARKRSARPQQVVGGVWPQVGGGGQGGGAALLLLLLLDQLGSRSQRQQWRDIKLWTLAVLGFSPRGGGLVLGGAGVEHSLPGATVEHGLGERGDRKVEYCSP